MYNEVRLRENATLFDRCFARSMHLKCMFRFEAGNAQFLSELLSEAAGKINKAMELFGQILIRFWN